MLAHQLPALPDLDALLGRLPVVLAWLDDDPARTVPDRLPPVPAAGPATRVRSVGIQYWGSSLPLEAIRFAGSNRLLIEFWYHGTHRRVEPYSIRQAKTGNVLLYGWELAAGHIKAFKVDELSDVRTTSQSFSPRYDIDLATSGPEPGRRRY
jgi:hypothetical protein